MLLHDAIHVVMKFLLIFSETNFVEVLKICKIHGIYGPRNKSTLRYNMIRDACLYEVVFSYFLTYK